tara:strand:+ start:14614 stop:15012 length:399 start_codon:yes stop_codon:yes gene_type:complete
MSSTTGVWSQNPRFIIVSPIIQEFKIKHFSTSMTSPSLRNIGDIGISIDFNFDNSPELSKFLQKYQDNSKINAYISSFYFMGCIITNILWGENDIVDVEMRADYFIDNSAVPPGILIELRNKTIDDILDIKV